MTIAKHTLSAVAIFAVGLFFGCIITAKSLEIATQPLIENPLGSELFANPVMPPLPQYATSKTARIVK